MERAASAERVAMDARTAARDGRRSLARSEREAAAAKARLADLEGGGVLRSEDEVAAEVRAAVDAAVAATTREERVAAQRLVTDVALALKSANVDRALWRLKCGLRRHVLAVLAVAFHRVRSVRPAKKRAAARRATARPEDLSVDARRPSYVAPRSRASDFLPEPVDRYRDAIRRQGTTIPSYY